MTPGDEPEPAPWRDQELVVMVARQTGDHAALAERVTELEDRVEEIASAFDDVEDAFVPGPPPAHATGPTVTGAAQSGSETRDAGPQAEGEEAEVGLDMRRLVGWVRDNVALLLERKVPQTGGYPYWCRKWWMHPEAIARFEAARRSWAEAVTAGEGNAMVVYFEHLDHQLGVLCGESGPFCGCKGGVHRDSGGATALGHDEPDESYFLDYELAGDSHGHQ